MQFAATVLAARESDFVAMAEEKKWHQLAAPYLGYEISRDGKIRKNSGNRLELRQHYYPDRGGMVVELHPADDEGVQSQSRPHILVHVLLAQTFIPNADNKPCVRFKDGDYSNLSLDNLQWADQPARGHKRKTPDVLPKNPDSKVTLAAFPLASSASEDLKQWAVEDNLPERLHWDYPGAAEATGADITVLRKLQRGKRLFVETGGLRWRRVTGVPEAVLSHWRQHLKEVVYNRRAKQAKQ